jgi:hypothetical protein
MAAKIVPLALVLGATASVALAEPAILTEAMLDDVTAAGRTDLVANGPGFAGLGRGEAGARLGAWVRDLRGRDGDVGDPCDVTVVRGNLSRQVRVVRAAAGRGDASVHQRVSQTSTTELISCPKCR